MSSNGFLFKSGTRQFSAGYPIGNNSNNFSFDGRFSKALKAGPQFKGVDVKLTRPAF